MAKPYEKILFKNISLPGYTGTLAEYLTQGGYEGARQALTRTPAEVIEIVKRSGLRGRGGAGFPTGVKWGFVPQTPYTSTGQTPGQERYLCCNADESEPGTFKDRELIEKDPHQMIEGMIIAGYALGVRTAYIYLRGEFAQGARVLSRALAEAEEKGLLRTKIFGTEYALTIHVHRGAGAYICGEETALLNSLEGRRGEPRMRPPFPAVRGLYGCPTVVNNVETLANLPSILRRGPEWYAGIGTAKSTGTRIFSVSGHVKRPGNHELPITVSLRELLFEHAGGIREGHHLKAVIPGGSSAPVLTPEHLDVTMDFESLAAAGSMGGSGGVIVMDETTCMVRVGEIVARFYHHESCGQCTQCREGTAWVHKVLGRMERGEGKKADMDLLLDVCDNMKGKTICVLSDACALPIESYLRYFREEFEEHVRLKACPFRVRETAEARP